jgi:glycosyltransferase involved in cell wall biosynthesis
MSSQIRALHLFSNAKWTGPAEPALTLCAELRKAGVDADFACPPTAPGSPYTLLDTAREWGIEPILDFTLSKHENPLVNWQDQRKLRSFLKRNPYDLVHCHLNNDHRIACHAANGTPIVRSNYEGLGFSDPRRVKGLLKRTARLLDPSNVARANDVKRFKLSEDKVDIVPSAIDTSRFDPDRDLPDIRARLKIPADAFVVGIVARMQPHRHFDDLWDALGRLVKQDRKVHALIVGRGTRQETVARQPVRERGLDEWVHFSGFLRVDEYVAAVNAFDVKVFLVPGTDGTCRAVREAMAMGKPAVVSNRGMLPEIVDDGENGLVFGSTADELYTALRSLTSAPERVREMGAAARKKAVDSFSPRHQAEAVRAIYERVLEQRRTGEQA